jgi:hypothetical protein
MNGGIKILFSSNDEYKSKEMKLKYGFLILLLITKIKKSNGTRKLQAQTLYMFSLIELGGGGVLQTKKIE